MDSETAQQFEVELQAQEMRNEFLLARYRNGIFLLLLGLHAWAFAAHFRAFVVSPGVVAYVVGVNAINLAIWFHLKSRPAYNSKRGLLLAEFEFLSLTGLVWLNGHNPMMPVSVRVTVPVLVHLLLLAINGLRYHQETVLCLWLQAVLLDSFVFANNMPPPANVPPAVASFILLSTLAACVSYIVSSLRRVHFEAVARQQASERKSLFLANVSHELKTPLTSILGYSTALSDGLSGALNEQQAASLEVIRSNARVLLCLIEDLLDISKIEAGKLELELTDFSLGDCVEFAYDTLKPQIESKGLDFAADMPGDNVWVRGDYTRLCQVFVNLIGNAVKYTEHGGVRVEMAAAHGRACVAVSDTGPGIAPQQLAHIFDEFVRADRRQEGSGLGLAICRRLVTMHGGDIEVQSGSTGSTFTVSLPLLDEAQGSKR